MIMERLELLNLGFNLTTAGHGLNALVEANDRLKALLNPTRVSDVHDMHDDYPTLPAIVLPSETTPVQAYAFRTRLADCEVYTCMAVNPDGVTCGVFSPDDNTWTSYELAQSLAENAGYSAIGDDLSNLTYSTLFDRLDLKHMDTIEI